MSDQFFWYVTRSAALIAWLSSALSILVGLLTSSRLLGRRPTIPWLVDLHRMFAGISVTFLGIHMASLWLDSFVRFRLDDLLIPWVASVPGLTRTSIALGVISAWLLAAVQSTSLIRERLPQNVWRAVHLLSFGTLGFGTLHALQVGSDSDNIVVLGIGVSLVTAIVLTSAVRVIRLLQPSAGATPPESEPQQTPVHGTGQRQSSAAMNHTGPSTPQPGTAERPEINGATGTGTIPQPAHRRPER